MNRLSPLLVALLLAVTAPALAQLPHYIGPQVPVPAKPAPAPPETIPPLPRTQEDLVPFLLRLQESLMLTPEQIYQLTRVANETDQAVRQRVTALQLYKRTLTGFLAGESLDLGRAEAIVWTLGIARIQLHIEQLRGVARAMDLLTAKQQQRLRGLGFSLESLALFGPEATDESAPAAPADPREARP